jgi:hypothetical protein
MTWGEVCIEITKKLATIFCKVVVFLVWLITTSMEILLRELNRSMRQYLFPNKR